MLVAQLRRSSDLTPTNLCNAMHLGWARGIWFDWEQRGQRSYLSTVSQRPLLGIERRPLPDHIGRNYDTRLRELRGKWQPLACTRSLCLISIQTGLEVRSSRPPRDACSRRSSGVLLSERSGPGARRPGWSRYPLWSERGLMFLERESRQRLLRIIANQVAIMPFDHGNAGPGHLRYRQHGQAISDQVG